MAETHVKEGGIWGVVVVLSAFFIQAISFGSTQSIGVYNIEFLKAFDSGATAVSLVGSINFGICLGAGPICSFLMAKWSHRQVAFLGAILANIGLICMPFAPNLPYMYAFYGVLAGLGNSFVYVPSHILSGLYYSRHRSIATGIATAGSGIGSTVFPIIVYNCIQYYGWRGSLFILAGLNLHLFICAALLRPVPNALLKAYELQEKTANAERREGVNNDIGNIRSGHNLREQSQVYFIDVNNSQLNPVQDTETIGTEQLVNGGLEMDDDTLGITVREFVNVVDLNHSRLNSHHDIETHGTDKNDIALDENIGSGIDVEGKRLNSQHIIETVKYDDRVYGHHDIEDDILGKNVTKVVNDVEVTGYKRKVVDATTSTLFSSIDPSEVQTENKVSMSQKIISHLKMVFTFDFLMFWLSNVCWNAGYGIVVIFLPKYMTTIGLTEENASIVLSAFGAGNGLGCVVGGLLGNIKCCNRITVYICGNIGACAFTLLVSVPYLHTFIGLMFLTSIFALMYGVILGLLVVLTSDLLGTEALGYGFGYLMLSNGIGVFGGPPFAGALIDHYGSLDPALYMSACFALCGAIVMAVVLFRRIYSKHCINTKQ